MAEWHQKHKQRRAGELLLRRMATKLKMVELKGGQCSICGYNKSLAALEFHHVDATTKKFTLAAARAPHMTWKRVKRELDKTILLCSNCHREVEYPHSDYARLKVLQQELKQEVTQLRKSNKVRTYKRAKARVV